MTRLRLFVGALFLVGITSGLSLASGLHQPPLSDGQTVYVAVYSNVFSGPRASPKELETILSVRNTDMKKTLTITCIDYYDTDGKLMRRHLTSPVTLGPLSTKYIHVKESESAGGPGSNFIVKWQAAKKMNPPMIESVMLSLRGGQGISFAIPGQVITEE